MDSSALHSLAWLLNPVSPAEFLAEYWEKKPLHITNRSPDYYRSLYSLDDFDHTLLRARFHSSDIFVSKHEQKVPIDSFLNNDGYPKMTKLYELYRDGHTIYFYQLHRLHDRARELCRRVENELGQESFPAAFLTPARSQGAKAHYDVPNIFVLQIEGSKTWRLHRPIGDKPFRLDDIVTVKASDLGPPELELVLHPGDLLYFPRGYIHEPFTQDSYSLHITLGLMARVWWDVFKVTLDRMLRGHPRFREPLPPDYLTREPDDATRQHFQSLLQELVDSCDLDASLQALREEFFRNRQPLPDGHFRQLQLLDEITPATVLEKRAEVLTYVHWDEGFKAAISFSGGKVMGPPFIEPMLRDIAQRQGPFRARDIPTELGDDARLALIRQLVKSGLLRVVSNEPGS